MFFVIRLVCYVFSEGCNIEGYCCFYYDLFIKIDVGYNVLSVYWIDYKNLLREFLLMIGVFIDSLCL